MLFASPMADALAIGALLSAAAIIWIVLLIRLNGLRSLSKMTNFDFIMTIAMGSLLAGASQSQKWTAFVQTIAAMAALFAIQYAAARLRRVSKTFADATQNTPVVLMRDGEFLEEALAATRVSRNDVLEKLRKANVLNPDHVRAVVLETTGDVSVLHGEGPLDPRLLEGVRSL